MLNKQKDLTWVLNEYIQDIAKDLGISKQKAIHYIVLAMYSRNIYSEMLLQIEFYIKYNVNKLR